ncbi:hypothetical protein [Okeania sp.]|uniref:hypothetical protein n=1 Tax=Okeania sp. TaxID=3100323 RepID=UPI002B4ABDA3|nr:hypothetical protein [Okeania sp.]MEB3341172.1 hypothetical protein [Okeania sp.]
MARYTGIFTVSFGIEDLQPIFIEILTYCGCEIIYNRRDYLMARELPGQVSFPKLVYIDINLERLSNATEKTRIKIVVRSEELAVKLDNHCYQVFYLLTKLIVENSHWELLESIINN